MREFDIFTPGEKIKKIRNCFDIKQEDLAGGEITRNLISIIENNKANLTEATAKILTMNVNRICKERNINYSVDEGYLLEDVFEQAQKIAEEYIEDIDKLSDADIDKIQDKLQEIDFFCKSYNPGVKKSELYILIGRKFELNRQYVKAFDYYLKAYESSVDKKLTLSTLLSLGICSMHLSKYEEAIHYCSLLLDLGGDRELEYRAIFNKALSYQKLSKFEKTLDTIDKINEDYTDFVENSVSDYIDLTMITAGCLNEVKSFNKAITIYNEALGRKKLGENEVLLLSGLSDVYRTTKDFTKLKKISDKMLKIMSQKEYFLAKYEGLIFLTIAKNLKAIDRENDEVVALLFKAIDYFKSGKSALIFEDVKLIFELLLENLIENRDHKKIVYLKNEFFELIEKGGFSKRTSINLMFLKYYNEEGKTEDINSLVDFLVK